MHRAFHLERQYVATNLCPCNGCTQANNLKLKFVAHVGEVATQTIRQRRKLVGIDVILVHRLLKNPVRSPSTCSSPRSSTAPPRRRPARSRARGVPGPRGDRPGSRVLRGRRGPPGLAPSAAGSLVAGAPREDPVASPAPACRTCWGCGADAGPRLRSDQRDGMMPRVERSRHALIWVPALVLGATVAQLAVATFVPGIERFDDKAFGARLARLPGDDAASSRRSGGSR